MRTYKLTKQKINKLKRIQRRYQQLKAFQMRYISLKYAMK